MKTKIDDLRAKLIAAKDAYYNTAAPVMSDAQFDALEDELRALSPDDEYFSFVGTIVRGKKITHDKPMLSMQKAKTMEEVEKWMSRLALDADTEFCVQPKIDGLSANCRYENGKLAFIATRGDGTIGQDISHVAKFIKDIPLEIAFSKDSIDVRGELYLPKTTEFDTQGRPLRNNCVGLINRKEGVEDLKHVRFLAYQIEGTDLTNESEKIDLLKKNGFNTFSYLTTNAPAEISGFYLEYLKTYRNEWEYETDGLIITVNDNSLFEDIDARWVVDHHHHYAIALKPPAEEKETRLMHIEWQVSRQGNVIPVAVFDPVYIGGARIERASLSNAATVRKISLHIGDTLLIERANDVIPYVKGNLSSADRTANDTDLVPSTCPSCNEALSDAGVHVRCTNRSCPEINIQMILFWIKQAEVENVAEATVRTLYTMKKIASISDLYAITDEALSDVPGFAEKKKATFLSEIAKTKELSAVDLISRLGIPLVQKKTLKNLGISSIEDFITFNDTTYIVGQNIIQWKNDPLNMAYLETLLRSLSITTEENTSGLSKVCMTGKGPAGRKELAKMISEMGYEFTDDMTKDVSILLCEDPSSASSKLTKAKKLGIQIVSYEEFFKSR